MPSKDNLKHEIGRFKEPRVYIKGWAHRLRDDYGLKGCLSPYAWQKKHHREVVDFEFCEGVLLVASTHNFCITLHT